MKRFEVFNSNMPRPKREIADPNDSPFVIGLRQLIAARNVNQKWLSAEMKMSEQAVSTFLRGKNRYLPTLERAAAVFGKTYGEVEEIGRRILEGVFENKTEAEASPAPEGAGAEQMLIRQFQTDMQILKQELANVRLMLGANEQLMRELRDILARHPLEAEPPLKKAR